MILAFTTKAVSRATHFRYRSYATALQPGILVWMGLLTGKPLPKQYKPRILGEAKSLAISQSKIAPNDHPN